MPDFDRLHSRFFDQVVVACAFDLLMLSGDDLRRKPFAEREAALRKLLKHEPDGIQYVEHTEGDGGAMFDAVWRLGLEGVVSKRLTAPYRSRSSKTGPKSRTPKAPAAIRIIDGTF
jgi:bifunctional non-homologous end joining protein LigD